MTRRGVADAHLRAARLRDRSGGRCSRQVRPVPRSRRRGLHLGDAHAALRRALSAATARRRWATSAAASAASSSAASSGSNSTAVSCAPPRRCVECPARSGAAAVVEPGGRLARARSVFFTRAHAARARDRRRALQPKVERARARPPDLGDLPRGRLPRARAPAAADAVLRPQHRRRAHRGNGPRSK